jgi:hypothetical protein
LGDHEHVAWPVRVHATFDFERLGEVGAAGLSPAIKEAFPRLVEPDSVRPAVANPASPPPTV